MSLYRRIRGFRLREWLDTRRGRKLIKMLHKQPHGTLVRMSYENRDRIIMALITDRRYFTTCLLDGIGEAVEVDGCWVRPERGYLRDDFAFETKEPNGFSWGPNAPMGG